MGGAETQTINQINELVKRGRKVQLIVLSSSAPLGSQLHEGISLHILNIPALNTITKAYFMSIPKVYKQLIKLINQFNPEAILGILPPSHFLLRLIKPFLRNKTKIFFYHRATENAQSPANSYFKRLLKKWIQYNEKKNAFFHLYISEAVKNDIESHLSVKHSAIVYNAIIQKSVGIEEQGDAINQIIGQGKDYILIPGRLHPVKGHIFFIEAMSDVIRKNNVQVVIAGYGPYREKIEGLINEKGLADHFVLTGQIENYEMLCLMSGAKAVVIPSIEEGLGNVAIESIMLGQLTIVSNAGGLPEVINDGQNGFVFEKLNAQALEDVVKRVVIDGEANLQFTAEQIKMSYEKRFTFNAQIDKLVDLINAPNWD